MFVDLNIAITDVVPDGFRLTYFNAALLEDTKNVLERHEPIIRRPGMIRIASNTQVSGKALTIRSYLHGPIDSFRTAPSEH